MKARLSAGLALVAALAGNAGRAAARPEAPTIARGRYLATAADCVACHSVPGQPAFSGGNVFNTPFGTLYAPNITPDRATGIGAWSDTEFLRALRQGVGRRGEHLYPAFPYAEYTGLSDADALAIKAYLFSLPAAERPATRNRLSFPFSVRSIIAGWKLLNFRDGRFVPDPARSAEVNRGRYLAETLGHCGECHSPRTWSYGIDRQRALAGGIVDGWTAYNITPHPIAGIGAWSTDDIATYLATGALGGRAQAAGPMADVVSDSTRFLTDADRHAIALYLKAQPPIAAGGASLARSGSGHPDRDRLSFSAGGDPATPSGRAIYVAACASCHGMDGTGVRAAVGYAYPPMIGNSTVGAPSADNLILTILHGVTRDAADRQIHMPSFGAGSPISEQLGDAEITRLATYIVGQFGNPAATIRITPAHVFALRGGDDESGQPWPAIAGALIVAAAAVMTAILVLRRRRGPPTSPPGPKGERT